MHKSSLEVDSLDIKKMAKSGLIPSGCPMHKKGGAMTTSEGGGVSRSECPVTGAASSTLMTDSRTDDIDPQNMVSKNGNLKDF